MKKILLFLACILSLSSPVYASTLENAKIGIAAVPLAIFLIAAYFNYDRITFWSKNKKRGAIISLIIIEVLVVWLIYH
jgi:hypothetical protein